MSITRYFNIHRSLITRVVMCTMASALVVFLVAFGVAYHIATQGLKSEADKRINQTLDIAVDALDNELQGVEDAAANTVQYLRTNFPDSDQEMTEFLKVVILSNSFIQGSNLGYNPDANGGRRYAPYILANKDTCIVQDLALSQPRYATESPWYAHAAQQGRSMWNKPVREINGTNIITYSMPFTDANNRLKGVFALDVNLEQIELALSLLKPFEGAKIFVLDRDMNFLVAPDMDDMVGKPIEELMAATGGASSDSILHDIKHRVRDDDVFRSKGQDMRLYYAPTKHAGMTIAVVIPAKLITAPVSAFRRIMTLLWLLGVAAMAIAIIVVLRRQMQSIGQFTRTARSIAAGNFNTPIPPTRDPNELFRLGKALDEMQTSLRTYVSDLSATQQEKGKIENELRIASGIQRSMLPKRYPPFPERDDLDIYGSLTPAREVGGDLFDFFIRDEKLYFCIGDVAGKGVPASLMMAVTRSLLRIVCTEHSSPSRIMTTINNTLLETNDNNMFVTMFVGVLDLPTGKLRYCNAGHNAPLLLGGGTAQPAKLPVEPHLPLGVLQGMAYHSQETVLGAGDLLFLYTDGLTEAENKSHQLLGEQEMTATVARNHDGNAHDLVHSMLQLVKRHASGAEQSDDLTMLAIRYAGQHQQARPIARLTLTNKLEEISRLESFAETIGQELGIDLATVTKLNLALEEAVANVINYAYPPGTEGQVEIVASATPSKLKVTITDQGQPFDPTAQRAPDVTLGVQERQIGGLGIFLIRNIMDSVNYERAGGCNVLTLRKHLKQQHNNS